MNDVQPKMTRFHLMFCGRLRIVSRFEIARISPVQGCGTRQVQAKTLMSLYLVEAVTLFSLLTL